MVQKSSKSAPGAVLGGIWEPGRSQERKEQKKCAFGLHFGCFLDLKTDKKSNLNLGGNKSASRLPFSRILVPSELENH